MKLWPIRRIYRIPLIYSIFSILWILFSDKIAFTAAPSLAKAALYSTIKGLLFVTISTLLIYLLLRRDESSKEHLVNEIMGIQRSFNLLFEDNPQPMWIFNNHTFEIMAVNPAACRTYGYSAAEFRKLKITDLRAEEDIPELMDILADRNAELHQSGPYRHIKKDGESMMVRIIAHPLRSAGIDSTLVSVTDLTEYQKTLNELNVVVQERDDFESFGYTASHDLKATLRAIIGYSEILQNEYQHRLDDEGNGFVAQIKKAGLAMNEMLDDMLILSGINRKPLDYELIDLTAIFEETIKTLRLQDAKRKIKVTIQPGMRLVADVGAIRLIIQNLLQNAWKYTMKTSRAQIHVGSFVNEGGETAYFVKDNGLGFDQSYAEQIFEPFKRAHMNKVIEGLGIGLSIVRRAIERQGGRIWVEAEVGKGACFYFTLPQKNQTGKSSTQK